MRAHPGLLLLLSLALGALFAAPVAVAQPTVVDFEGAPTGFTNGDEYVAVGVVLGGVAGVQEFNYAGGITEVVTSGDWFSPLEIRFVAPGDHATDGVTTAVSMRNHFGPGGAGSGTDVWTATTYGLDGAPIETKQLTGDGVLSFTVGEIHRVVLDDVGGTAFAMDDLTFEPPTACGKQYGVGCPGSGGFTPTLRAVGCDEPSLSLIIDDGLGGANAFLFLGLAPAAAPLGGGCFLRVAPAVGPLGPLPLGGPGAGTGTVTLTVPHPVVGATTTVTVQAFLDDGGGAMSFSTTNGLELTFEP